MLKNGKVSGRNEVTIAAAWFEHNTCRVVMLFGYLLTWFTR